MLQSIIDSLDDDAPEDLYFAHEMLSEVAGVAAQALKQLDQLIDHLEATGGVDEK